MVGPGECDQPRTPEQQTGDGDEDNVDAPKSGAEPPAAGTTESKGTTGSSRGKRSISTATGTGSGVDVEDLPRAVVRRIVKAKLQALGQHNEGESSSRKKEVQVAKDAMVALTESARVFIHYLTATANEVCRSHKRQTVSAADILEGIEAAEFEEFLPALEGTLQALREEKNAKRKEASDRINEAKEVDK
eukprot:TRINITY_DN25706_c0_g1_i1.p1 TRINITY_DN25706_c0_g1~~TRINITY_DN25706_c0_g1_i1.p1  ORF type:complete len:190 (-),score=4.77 TRINITY_DN25706_c0_g1_i1:242-811(-)